MMDPATNDAKSRRGSLLLEMRDLRIEAQTGDSWQELVHGINLTLSRGEILGLIGESGAGKSTIGFAAMGYARDGCRISGGTVQFDGLELTTASSAQLRAVRGSRIAYVAQSAAAAFNPAHRLLDQCTEAAATHGLISRAEAEAGTKAFYATLRLPEPEMLGLRYPHQVSGGQLQRAMTAMAMVCRPDLVIFDEPTTALDVTTQIEVLAAIRDAVQRTHTAAIYISHDLAVVAQMADRIMVIRNGNWIEEGSTRSLLAMPKEQYTRDLLAARTFKKAPAAKEASKAPLLRVDHVTAAYGQATVLRDVSFEVPVKRTVAIVGESGSGKSTTARVITGLLQPIGGQVLWCGTPLATNFRRRSKLELQRVQMIYQMPDIALNPKQCIRDIIGRPISFYLGLSRKAQQERIRELLSLSELEPDRFIDRLPSELSGGQKQRICIARALAAEPELVICDEITSALDPVMADGILKLLDRLQQELGLSYIFISHDIGTVQAIADEVVVMFEGEIVESGPKAEIFKLPGHHYTDLLLSSVPQMEPDWLDKLLERRGAANAGVVRRANKEWPDDVLEASGRGETIAMRLANRGGTDKREFPA